MNPLSFVALSLLLATQSFAAAPDSEKLKAAFESFPTCQNFLRYDNENVYAGFGSYFAGMTNQRVPQPSQLLIAKIDDPSRTSQLAIGDSAIDVVRQGSSLFVLTYSSLEEWNLETGTRVGIYPTTLGIDRVLQYKEHPTSMVLYKNTILIAHGRLGVHVFDLAKRKVTRQIRLLTEQRPMESMASAITAQGNRAYITMDNFTLPTPKYHAFRGILVFNMDTLQVERTLGGLDPFSDAAVSDSQRLIVSFGGLPIWKYNLSDVTSEKKTLPEPAETVKYFPEQGHPIGRPAMDSQYYATCFNKMPAQPGGKYTKVVRVWDRKSLSLD